jgi:hypothetical protein
MINIKIRKKGKMSKVVECRLKLLEEIIKRRLVILESSVADLIPDTGSGPLSNPDPRVRIRTRIQMSRIWNTCASSGGRWGGGWSSNPPPPCPA